MKGSYKKNEERFMEQKGNYKKDELPFVVYRQGSLVFKNWKTNKEEDIKE